MGHRPESLHGSSQGHVPTKASHWVGLNPREGLCECLEVGHPKSCLLSWKPRPRKRLIKATAECPLVFESWVLELTSGCSPQHLFCNLTWALLMLQACPGHPRGRPCVLATFQKEGPWSECLVHILSPIIVAALCVGHCLGGETEAARGSRAGQNRTAEPACAGGRWCRGLCWLGRRLVGGGKNL